MNVRGQQSQILTNSHAFQWLTWEYLTFHLQVNLKKIFQTQFPRPLHQSRLSLK